MTKGSPSISSSEPDTHHPRRNAERATNPILTHTPASDLDRQYASVGDDIATSLSASQSQVQFRSNTIAPSPPPPESLSADLSSSSASGQKHKPSPLAIDGSLRLQTDLQPPLTRVELHNSLAAIAAIAANRPSFGTLQHKTSSSSLKPVSRTPSFKRAITNSIGTASAASSCYPSPIITAMGGVTPLPSPLLSGDSPGPWKSLGPRPPSRDDAPVVTPDSVLVSAAGESIASALANASKRKVYAGLIAAEDPDGTGASPGHVHKAQHGRNRSISEYIPDPMLIPKRQITVSGTHLKPLDTSEGTLEPSLRRELNLAEARGLTPTIAQPPTPPPSESSKDTAEAPAPAKPKTPRHEHFDAHGRHDRKRRRWRAVRLLGQGTFSRVMLATSQMSSDEDEDQASGFLTPTSDKAEPDRKSLVAVKVCEHGPRGGASEDRIEMSLKRELEILQTIHHPSLPVLKAWNIEPTRAILVLSYCPGGDLFEVASAHRAALTPALLRRMFAELVGAVRYLHERRIVHRDIKLENVLVNLPPAELSDPSTDWITYPHSVITLTDLGLSRRIADDERLETRCGSDDYAAPEVIMGQPYDGRATDAWSLGVLLYALLEARLPFDPPPGMSDAHRMRSRTSHRIARVEWRWIEYAGDDGDHEGSIAKFEEKGLLGAMEITEGLLKRARSRWTMDKVAETEWVRGAIKVDGGLKFREETEGVEVISPPGH